jgi:ABC-type uncharacterized transport system substrate-binding protein
MVTRRETAARTPASDAGPAPASSSGSQAARLPRLGFLSTGRADHASSAAFREGLSQAGQVEGQTFLLEARFSEGENDRLPALTAELVALPVDLIAVIGAVTVRAVRRASATVPLLFTIVLDPVADGLVPSMERPGGNTSGVTNFDPAQALAQMHLLKQVVPGFERVAILGDAGVPDLLDRANIAAAEAEGLRSQSLRLRGAAENLDVVFAAIRAERAQAVLGLYVPTIVSLHGRRLVEMATAARLPTMLPADWEAHRPLLTYGSSLVDGVRLMAGQADRVLRGAQVSDLSVEVVTRHRLTVNRRVAREIGLAVPPELLARRTR